MGKARVCRATAGQLSNAICQQLHAGDAADAGGRWRAALCYEAGKRQERACSDTGERVRICASVPQPPSPCGRPHHGAALTMRPPEPAALTFHAPVPLRARRVDRVRPGLQVCLGQAVSNLGKLRAHLPCHAEERRQTRSVAARRCAPQAYGRRRQGSAGVPGLCILVVNICIVCARKGKPWCVRPANGYFGGARTEEAGRGPRRVFQTRLRVSVPRVSVLAQATR